jgi:hypothetical protein
MLSRVVLLCVAVTAAEAQGPGGAAKNFFLADGRVQILSPGHPLELAVENEIPLRLKGPGLAEVVSEQVEDGVSSVPDQTGRTTPVLHHADGSAYINFRPIRLGKIKVAVLASFPDGGFERADAEMDVVPGSAKPVALIVAGGGAPGRDVFHTLRIDLDDPRAAAVTPRRPDYVYPAAWYPDVPYLIDLDKAFVKFSVKQPLDEPVVKFDAATGGVLPLRRGDALLETSYGGLTKLTCIQVRTTRDVFDRTNCGKLRPRVAPAPLDTTWPVDPDGLSSMLSAYGAPHPEALTVHPPNRPVEVAQAVEIPIEVRSDRKILRIQFSQRRSEVDDPDVPVVFTNSAAAKQFGQPFGSLARVVRDDGERKVLSIAPLGLGDLTVGIAVYYMDSTVSSESYFRMKVVPSAKELTKLELQQWKTPEGPTEVMAFVSYEPGLQLRMHHLDGMRFTLQNGAAKVPLKLDDEGRLLVPSGTSGMVEAEFDGKTATMWVGEPPTVAPSTAQKPVPIAVGPPK